MLAERQLLSIQSQLNNFNTIRKYHYVDVCRFYYYKESDEF